MGRYFCQKKQSRVTMNKANEYCLLKARCPELMVKKAVLCGGRLKTIIIPVVPVTLAGQGGCENGK